MVKDTIVGLTLNTLKKLKNSSIKILNILIVIGRDFYLKDLQIIFLIGILMNGMITKNCE